MRAPEQRTKGSLVYRMRDRLWRRKNAGRCLPQPTSPFSTAPRYPGEGCSPEIYWHSKDWGTISMRLGDRELGYRQGEPVRHADRVALRVTVRGGFEWTDAGRDAF